MQLHETIRDLVSPHGDGILAEASGFRGVLDDVLDEGDASTGDINLLVDAVRFDALSPLGRMNQGGADPARAVEETGARLARDRGGDDVTAACWATAVLGYAKGLVPEAVIGRYLGAGNVIMVRRLTIRIIVWGVGAGVVFGVLVAITRPLYDHLFSPDPAVQALLSQVLLVVACCTPIAGVVFVLDGVLIGAGDGRYLALAGLIAMIVYVPLAILVQRTGATVMPSVCCRMATSKRAKCISLTVSGSASMRLRLGQSAPRPPRAGGMICTR